MTKINLKALEPRIVNLTELSLASKSIVMSFDHDRTFQLWRDFGPCIKEIPNKVDNIKYSVQIFPDEHYFDDFVPSREFIKYAAVEVKNYEAISNQYEKLVIPEGKYAVFDYVGKPSEASETFRYILTQWLSKSKFSLDNRPHLAVMGDKYKGEHPESEEELFIPIK